MTFVELRLDFFRKLLYDDVDVFAQRVVVVESLGHLVYSLQGREMEERRGGEGEERERRGGEGEGEEKEESGRAAKEKREERG